MLSRRELLVADLLAAEGQNDEARRHYRELTTLDPSDPAPLHRLAKLALGDDDRETAERLWSNMLRRWPDLAAARIELARLALERRNLPQYLAHARHAVSTTDQPAHVEVELANILRLGGLHRLYGERTERLGGRPSALVHRDTVPLSTWLRPSQIKGIEQVLRLLSTFDQAMAHASQVDPRPVGIALRGLWLSLLRLPRLTLAMPFACQGLGLVGIPQLLGTTTDWLSSQILPYQHSLGTRLHAIGDRTLLSKQVDVDEVLYALQVLRVGDLDGDTLEEVCLTAPPSGRNHGNGYLELRSLDDGRWLRTWSNDEEDSAFARAAAVLGDIDGDLCNDLLIGTPSARYGSTLPATVELRSGRTGLRLWSIEQAKESFGVALAAIGDIDGDRLSDFVVGMPAMSLAADDLGRAFLCSGRTGAVVHELVAERSGVWFGGAVANAGDVTGDGIDDVAVGGNFGSSPGLVALYDSVSGARLTSFADENVAVDFGQMVLGVGDVDDDGRADLAISAPASRSEGLETGKVHILSSRTGKTLYELRGERAREGFGATMCRLPDWRGDRRPVLAVSAQGGGPVGNGYVRVFDLGRGSPLQTFAGNQSHRAFGMSLADLGDRDRNGLRHLGVTTIGRAAVVSLWSLSWADATPPTETSK